MRVLDEEDERFKKAPASFQDSPLGDDVKDALHARARPRRSATPVTLARERYQRNLDELNEHLRDAAKILIDITAAQRNQLDQAIAGAQVTVEESKAQHREAGRRARHLAVRRRVLARRARVLPADDHLEVREVVDEARSVS